MMNHVAWTIAGSDSAGYAGIQNDLKTFHALGVHGCSVITAITAQTPHAINNITYTSPSILLAQIETMEQIMPPKAIKIGMLGSREIVAALAPFLKRYPGKIVLDPLFFATSNHPLFSSQLMEYRQTLLSYLPNLTMITPNINEAEILTNTSIRTYADIENAAQTLITLGVKNVLIKGGHFNDGLFSQDYWTNGIESFWLSSRRQQNKYCRGTGCAMSSAITACLARGYTEKDAVVIAKMYINQGLKLASSEHPAALFLHTGWPEREDYLPYLSSDPLTHEPAQFNAYSPASTMLYPVVDNADWVKQLSSAGVKNIQLRIKNKNGRALESEIIRSVAIANAAQVNLFINDYWQLAIQHSAYGIHLGQSDLDTADINKIRNAGLRLGISTHCYYEVARAHAIRPSYIACGPIFATTSKMMPFAPQGLEQLKRWRKTLSYPLIAIGGINHTNILDVVKTNVQGVAMISAISESATPLETAKHYLSLVSSHANHA